MYLKQGWYMSQNVKYKKHWNTDFIYLWWKRILLLWTILCDKRWRNVWLRSTWELWHIDRCCQIKNFIQVFSQRTFLWALQFLSFHLQLWTFILDHFPFCYKLPVLFKSVPVEAKLDGNVSTIFGAMRIVWLLLMPVLTQTTNFIVFFLKSQGLFQRRWWDQNLVFF